MASTRIADYLDIGSLIWKISVSLNLNDARGRLIADYNVINMGCWQLQGAVMPPDDSKHPTERVSQQW